MPHTVSLIQDRGLFLGGGGINGGSCNLPDVELTRRINCPTIYKIKEFHLFDMLFIHQPKNPTKTFFVVFTNAQ